MKRILYCPYQKWADDYTTGKLSREQEKEFKLHLVQCPICTQRVEQNRVILEHYSEEML